MFANNRKFHTTKVSCRYLWAVICMCATVLSAAMTGKETQTITSNTIHELAGNGDTLWMVTRGGLNFTIDNGSSLSWWGLTTEFSPWNLHYSQAAAFACVGSETQENYNSFFIYNHETNSYNVHDIPWGTAVKNKADLNLFCTDAAPAQGYYWLACVEGGLVRWNFETDDGEIFIPGIDSAAFSPRTWAGYGNPDIFTADSTEREEYPFAVELAVDTNNDTLLYLAAEKMAFTFLPADSLWDTLSNTFEDDNFTFLSYNDLFYNSTSPKKRIYASITVKRKNQNNTEKTLLFSYRFSDSLWIYKAGNERGEWTPRNVAFVNDTLLYYTDSTKVHFYKDDSVSTALNTDSTSIKIRMSQNEDILSEISDPLGLEVTDIAVMPYTDTTLWRVWIATPEGLLYIREESIAADEEIVLEKRAPELASCLDETYAFPGILTTSSYLSPEDTRTRFAYNLCNDGKVTIRIYDFNMDLVKTVIENEPRKAGKNRTVGRSTESDDFWDGKNEYGRTVTPGVYYYKITSSTGERSFGKIIVALQK